MWYQIMFHDPTFEVSNGSKFNVWSDTTLKKAFKTSFNIIYLRFALSPMIFQIPQRTNEVQVLWNY